jgi:hypothetical protein
MGWPRPDFAPNVEIGPQVACVTEGSASIVWRTLGHVRGDVEARSPGGAWRVYRGALGTGRSHEVLIDGLDAGSTVEYRLLHDRAAVKPVYRFRTAVAKGAAGFTFAVIGDTGSGGAGQLAMRDRLAEVDADFVLHVGDLAYDHGRVVEAVRRHFTPYRDSLAQRPWYVAWGNHDVMTEEGIELRKLFRLPQATPKVFNRYYAVDWGNTRVWALDMTIAHGKGSPQFQWLKSDLEQSRHRWKIVLGHYPPYSGSPYASTFKKRWRRLREELCPLLDENGVDLYFAGHTHGYERTHPIRGGKRAGDAPGPEYVDPAGTIYLVCGGGGKRLSPAGSEWWTWTAKSARTLELFEVRVEADTLDLRVIGAGGDTLDAIRLRKSRPAR